MKIYLILILLSIYSVSEDLIDINFKDLELKELITITSKTINKSILVTDELKGKVDFISFKPVEKNRLLDILKFSLESNGYKLIENNNILRVVKNSYKSTEIFTKKSEEVSKNILNKKTIKKNSKQDKETNIIFLTNIEVEYLQKVLKLILKDKKLDLIIAYDDEFNSVILNGKKDSINQIKEIIAKLDIAKKQVYIKANIVELDNNLLEDIGLRFGILGGSAHSGGLYTFASNLNDGSAIIDVSNLSMSIPNLTSSIALGASLSLLNKTYALDVISQPSILCINNKESSIYVGETISIQTGSSTTDGGTVKNSFQREDIGLTLKVKPRVSNDNKVLIDINTIIEGIKNENYTNSNPNTNKKEIKTTAFVNNGESVIIGGLIENKNQKTVDKIPIMSDIPLIGELFKNRLNDSQNRSLVLIITPYVIPESKDLTYIRNELAKLKRIEDKFLEQTLINLKIKKRGKITNPNIKNEQVYNKNIENYFNVN